MKNKTLTSRNIFINIYNRVVFCGNLYFNSFKKNIKSSVLEKIDNFNFEVILHIRGTRECIPYKLCEVIFDIAIISSLSSEDASDIGYNYGLHYKEMGLKNHNSYTFMINPSEKRQFTLLSLDRKKNITFSFQEKNKIKSLNMNPEDIFKTKSILKGFHPVQACYIGILAGIRKNSTNNSAQLTRE